jgi:DNA polymerase-3 subunit gamma/tau
MSYRVLARAYRSNTFDDLVGQEVIATTLKNAITSGRIHHGYLFTGTRGVGKTSTARILAKALNCLSADAPTPTPCCTCDACTAIASGEDVDVVEIDAASNRGIDNIRTLRTNAVLRPSRSRYKVYIVDEVHMLTTEAFNALLKTLEEPPQHIKFILATTDPQKVPATILSRCQRFDFRAIGTPQIAEHLGRVLASEGKSADDAALRRIARLGNGSMRDALSLLDQVLSYGEERITTDLVERILPPAHDELAFAVVQAIARTDPAAALQAFDEGLQAGRTIDQFCETLLEHVRTLMLLNVCGPQADIVDIPESVRESMVEQASTFDAPTYVFMIGLLDELRRQVKFSAASRALAEAAIARLALVEHFTELRSVLERLDGAPASPTQARPAGPRADEKKNAPPPNRLSPAPTESQRDPLEAPQRPERFSDGRPRASQNRECPPGDRGTEGESAPGSAAVLPRRSADAPTEVAADESVSTAEWQAAARDPFVRRVQEVFDGSLHDVRARRRGVAAAAAPGAPQSGDGDPAPPVDETETPVEAIDPDDHPEETRAAESETARDHDHDTTEPEPEPEGLPLFDHLETA